MSGMRRPLIMVGVIIGKRMPTECTVTWCGRLRLAHLARETDQDISPGSRDLVNEYNRRDKARAKK